MNNNIIRSKLKSVISESKLNKLGKELEFTKRQRDVCAFNMINALIASMGEGKSKSLADLSRDFNSLTGHDLAPKPYHNQLKKSALEKVLRQVTSNALSKWVRSCYEYKKMYKKYFTEILLHDGSTLSLHKGLKDEFPGRFTATSPAAIELHVSMNLMSNSVDSVTISADKESERQFLPDAKNLAQTLLMADAGYFDKSYIKELNDNDGFFIIRAALTINPTVVSGIRCDNKPLKFKQGTKLKDIKDKLPKRKSFELSIQWDNQDYRLIGFWIADKKKYSYIITNLPAADFDLKEVGQLYRLRWQIELLFKEWKSHNQLKKFNTQNPTIVYSLVWVSLLALTLKRLLSGYVEEKFQIVLSPLTVSKTTQGWWYPLFQAILDKSQKRILSALAIGGDILRRNAKLSSSHLKRDRNTGKFQFLIQPIAGFK